MTTNAVLIDKYLDFLVKNDFFLTISLDGNRENHSYRLYKDGRSSFDKVFANVKMIQERYPVFFEKNISFNSVLHNRSSVEEVHDFIYGEFGKVPEIHALNDSGVKENCRKDFERMYRPYTVATSLNDLSLMGKRFTSDPKVFSLGQFLLWYGNNQFFDYESLLYAKYSVPINKTGTCFPFSRKMFITVNNKILVCERINQKYVLGKIDEKGVHLNLKEIVEKYNCFYQKMEKQCENCYMVNGCHQCIFQLDNLDENPICQGFRDEYKICEYLKVYIDLLEENRIPFTKLLNEIQFS